MPPLAFQLFGAAHVAMLLLIVVIPLALSLWSQRSAAARERIPWAMAILIVANLLLHVRDIAGNTNWAAHLPMHLCDWAGMTAILALLRGRQLAYELTYFWGLAGTLQALLTPDLSPEASFASVALFFLGHGLVLTTAIYLTSGLGMRPGPDAVWRAFAGLNVYALVAGVTNAAFGTNYGYLAAKPDRPSLLDHLGPWPLYILSVEALALVLFGLLQLPHWLARRRSRCSRAL